MLPKINETISLVSINVRDRTWIVKTKRSAVVESVEIIDNQSVHITTLSYGRQYHCQRPFCPTTLQELRHSVWMPTVSRRAPSDHYLFVEEVLAFNVHRELGRKAPEFVYDDAPRRGLVPYTPNAYCAVHDRVHYWSASLYEVYGPAHTLYGRTSNSLSPAHTMKTARFS